MGISGEIKENFIVNEDGTIKRSSNELDLRMLNIIRVGANKENPLAAYRARKQCYKLCKKSTHRDDYKAYVEGLQLDHYPNEFVKAELGQKILRQYWWLLSIVGILFLPLLIRRHNKLSKRIKECNDK